MISSQPKTSSIAVDTSRSSSDSEYILRLQMNCLLNIITTTSKRYHCWIIRNWNLMSLFSVTDFYESLKFVPLLRDGGCILRFPTSFCVGNWRAACQNWSIYACPMRFDHRSARHGPEHADSHSEKTHLGADQRSVVTQLSICWFIARINCQCFSVRVISQLIFPTGESLVSLILLGL